MLTDKHTLKRKVRRRLKQFHRALSRTIKRFTGSERYSFYPIAAFLIISVTVFCSSRRNTSIVHRTRISGESVLSYSFADNIIVSELNKFMYCPIPKAANSNWKYLIRKFEGLSDYKDLTKAHNHNVSGLRYLTDYSSLEVEQLLADPSYFKFVFVRNPYRRLLSCYMDKFQNHDKIYVESEYQSFLAQLYSWHFIRNINVKDSNRPSFEMFVDEILKHEPSSMNSHWMPQTLHCGLGLIPYDFIGRIDNVKEDAAHVLEILGRGNETFPSQKDIGFPPSGASEELMRKMYSEEVRLKVKALYDMDFQYLGYGDDL